MPDASPRARVLALLLACATLAVAPSAQAVGAGCEASSGPGDDGRPSRDAACQVAGTPIEVPDEAAPLVFVGLRAAHTGLVAGSACPSDGECTIGPASGPNAGVSSTQRNGTHELKGHVTLIR